MIMTHQPFLPEVTSLAAGGFRPFWEFAGVFHPATTHFPIALLTIAGLLAGVAVVRRRREVSSAAFTCLWFGTIGAVVAAVLGWADGEGRTGDVIFVHRWSGVAVAVIGVGMTAVATAYRRRPVSGLLHAYHAGTIVLAGLVGLTGFYGGKITHGSDHYSDAFATLVEELRAGEPAGEAAETAVEETDEPPSDAVPRDPTADPASAPNTTVPNPTAPNTTAPTTTTAPAGVGAAPAAGPLAKVDFKRDIWPIFEKSCIECHGEEKEKGEYRMDTKAATFLAGESKVKPIIPGRASESPFFLMVQAEGEWLKKRMPAKPKKRLPRAQVELIRRWIDQGAEWPE